MYGVFPYIATMLHEAGETARLDRRHRDRRLRRRRRALRAVGVAAAAAARRDAHDAPRRRWRMGFCLVVIAARRRGRSSSPISRCSASASTCCTRVIQIYASELAPAARGSAMALHSFFFFLGQAVGPIVYGVGLLHHRPQRRCCCSAPWCCSPPGSPARNGCAGRRRPRSSRARDRARRPGRAARRLSAACRPARTRRSACRRADTSSRRCAGTSA